MKGFLLGLCVAALAFGGYLYWTHRQPATPAVVARADAGAPVKKKRRRAARVAHNDRPGESEPEPIKLSAADLKVVGQGDDMSRPDVVHLDMASDKDAPELTQEDVDQRFKAQEPAILECISASRPDQEAYVPGKVTVKFRIQRTGNVRGVRVEAPSILQRGGLYDCLKKIVGGMRFPAGNGSQVITYYYGLS
jgi:hypothetical protein